MSRIIQRAARPSTRFVPSSGLELYREGSPSVDVGNLFIERERWVETRGAGLFADEAREAFDGFTSRCTT